ncbi:MAG: M28 family peptidase [Acidimicrobiia bacterium]|nr:M28 family peptidase [Acidimicrobiia bacterium]
MPRLEAILILGWVVAGCCPAQFSGAGALEYTRKVVEFGPRPPGSKALSELRGYLKKELRSLGWQMVEDRFTASTPLGLMAMENIMAFRRGKSGKAVVFTGHYDTKRMPGVHFVGANDGGSSTGLLLELARALRRAQSRHDVYLVFFDGEEALEHWSATDGLHGSRHLAARWQREGKLERIEALINVDMIGDRELGILRETNSSRELVSLIWGVAADLGYGSRFLAEYGAIEDDHMPFVRLGVKACDLIDFDYGPGNQYWHSEEDTMDKLSAASLEAVGRVLLETLKRLER